MLSSFFPNKNKVYSSRSLPEPAHPTSFLIMAIICRSWRGCKVALLCVCTGAIALFHVPLFLATSAHPFNWVNRWLDSFCLLQSGVHLPLFCCFCLLHDYECMLPISRWNAVHYNIAVDLKRFLYFKLIFWVLQYSYSFGILCEWNITLCCSCS